MEKSFKEEGKVLVGEEQHEAHGNRRSRWGRKLG